MPNKKIILASQSPRRKKLLEQIGLEFEIHKSEYEEDMQAKSDPYELAKFLAYQKARDVARHYDNAIVIGADTFIVFDQKLVGKPKDKAEARKILKKFSNNEHKVITGLAVIDTGSKKVFNEIGEAKVKFKELSDREIDEYIATGEPLDKAGAYGIQEKGGMLIDSIEGDFYSVIGLPINKVYEALREMGVDVLSPT